MQRSELADTLAALGSHLDMDHILKSAARSLGEYGESAGTYTRRAAKENPMAVLAAGAGLALLTFGAVKAVRAVNARAAQTPAETVEETAADWTETLRRKAEDLGEHVSETSAELREKFDDDAAALLDRLSTGLEDLDEAARDKVIAARLAAIDLQDNVTAHARTAAAKTKTTVEDNPVMFGLSAFAAGALAAALFPRSGGDDPAPAPAPAPTKKGKAARRKARAAAPVAVEPDSPVSAAAARVVEQFLSAQATARARKNGPTH